MNIFSLWKQLPNLAVTDEVNASAIVQTTQIKHEEDGYESTVIPPVCSESERERFDKWSDEGKPMSDQYRSRMEAQYGMTAVPEPLDQP